MIRVIRRLGIVLLALAVTLSALWACAAIWIDGPASRALAGFIVGAFVLVTLFVFFRSRHLLAAAGVYALLFAGVLGWWFSIAPSNDRQWQDNVARLPAIRIEGDRMTAENVRNFDYESETDYVERWETRSYDLSKLVGLDFFLSYWGPSLIAHTFVSWEFEGSPPLTISIETRKEVGQSYSAVKGFFRQFELYYVVSDERDVARVRTDFRNEQVYLYRLKGSAEEARELLLEYAESVNALVDQPVWYNALVHNCTTSILHHVRQISRSGKWDWRILANGYIDQLGYERGSINTSLPFDELRRLSHVNERAVAAKGSADFWKRIRVGLPERPTTDP